jgi:hypothetical protein
VPRLRADCSIPRCCERSGRRVRPTFVEIEEQRGVITSRSRAALAGDEVRDDHIRIPEGVGLDLGGLVKG